MKKFRFNSGLVFRDGNFFRVRVPATPEVELSVTADGKTESGTFKGATSLLAVVDASTGEPGPNPISLKKDKTYPSYFEFIFKGECILTKEEDEKGRTWLVAESAGKVSFFGQESDLPVSSKSFEGASWFQANDFDETGDPTPHSPN